MALPLFADDHQVGYAGYKGRLRTTILVLVATGLSCGKESVLVFTGVVEDHQGTVVAYEEG